MNQASLIRSLTTAYSSSQPTKTSTLIVGPWGAGKTHAIREVQKLRQSSSTYVVSLFGRESAESILDEISLQMLGRKATASEGPAAWAKSLTESLSVLARENIVGLTKSAGIIQKHIVEQHLEESALVVFDDLERKSRKVDLLDIFGLVEWLREHCCVIVAGNPEESVDSSDRQLLLKYREKLFDREFNLDRPENEAMIAVLRTSLGKTATTETLIHRIIERYERTEDTNLRTLRRIGIELSEMLGSCTGEDADAFLDNPVFLSSMVGLVIEKYSVGADLSDLTTANFLSEDNPRSVFAAKYSIPLNIGFNFAPFVRYIEHREVHVETMKSVLGLVEPHPIRMAFDKYMYWWCFDLASVEQIFKQLRSYIIGETVLVLGISDVLFFFYSTVQITQAHSEFVVLDRLESDIRSCLRRKCESIPADGIRVQIESARFSFHGATDRKVVDGLFEELTSIQNQRRHDELIEEFDQAIAQDDFRTAVRAFLQPGFPIEDRCDFIDTSLSPEIHPDHLRALGTILSENGSSPAATLVRNRLCSTLHESTDPIVRTRISRLCSIGKT